MIDERYQRNRTTISDAEQEELARKRVLVVGCGGLGGYVIECLARVGVGYLRIVDGDVFEVSNLNRQLLSSEMNLGKPKVLAAKHRVMAINNLVKVEVFKQRLNEENASGLLEGCDVVVDALDNIPDRLTLQKAAKEAGVVLVHGAVAGWWGQLCVVRPGENLLNNLYGESHEERGAEAKLGTPSFTPAIIGAMEVVETVKLLLGKPGLKGELLLVDLLNGTVDRIAL
ncbi:MAG: HesA/MoeB/ThiF family protein [Anaerolineaceae bacterium]